MNEAVRLSQVTLELSGLVKTNPKLISSYGSTKILCVEIENKRKSGKPDRFNVHFPNTIGVVLKEGMYIEIAGDIRSVNDKEEDLSVYQYVLATSIKVLDGEPSCYKNDVSIVNAELVNFDGVRGSYTDESKLLAVYRVRLNRKHERYSYFRVTTWGRDAVYFGNVHESAKYLHLKGRLQSYVSKSDGSLRFGYVTFFLEVMEGDEEKSELVTQSEVTNVSTVGDTE